MRHGDAAVRADGAVDDDLAALGKVGRLVPHRQQRQERRDAEGLVEGRRVDVSEPVGTRARGSWSGLRDGARDTRVGDEEVDVGLCTIFFQGQCVCRQVSVSDRQLEIDYIPVAPPVTTATTPSTLKRSAAAMDVAVDRDMLLPRKCDSLMLPSGRTI